MTFEDIVDRFLESRSEAYRLLFIGLATAVAERCAQAAEETGGAWPGAPLDELSEVVACGCGKRIAAAIRSANY